MGRYLQIEDLGIKDYKETWDYQEFLFQKIVQIKSGNNILYSTDLVLEPNESSKVLDINLPANNVGTKFFTASVIALENEKNKINNQKYNVLTFFPVVLFNQFKYFYNFFFLLLVFTQFFPSLKVGK